MVSYAKLVGIAAVFFLIIAVLPLSGGIFITHNGEPSLIRYSEPAAIEWSDDFEDGNYNGWTVTRGGYTASSGSLEATTDGWNWAYHDSNTAYGTWSFDVFIYSTGQLGVTFMANNLDSSDFYRPYNGYALLFKTDTDSVDLYKLTSSSEDVIDTYTPGGALAGWYHIDVQRQENGQINVYIDDELGPNDLDTTFDTSNYFSLTPFSKHQIDNIVVNDEAPEAEITRLTQSSADLSVGDTHMDANGHLWVSWTDWSNLNAMVSDSGTISLLPTATNMSPEADGSDNDQASCILRDQNGTLWLAYSVGTSTGSESVYIRSYDSGVLGDRHQVAQIAGTNREGDLVQHSDGSYSLLFSASDSIYTASSWHGFITHSDDLLSWTTPTQVTTSWGRLTRMTIDDEDNLYALIDNNDQGLKISKSEDGTTWSSPVTATSGHYGDLYYSPSLGKLFVAYFNPADDNIWVRDSTDGITWSTPWLAVDRTSSSNTECRICGDDQGGLLVTYMDNVGGHNDLFIASVAVSSITTSTTTSTTSTSTSTTPPPDLLTTLLIPGLGVTVVVIALLVVLSRRKGSEGTPAYQPMRTVPREPPGGSAPADTTENREIVLGALKSYPRVSMQELSELLDMPADQVRRITLRLIATGSVVGAFDRTMDEFVSVSATQVGRELKDDAEKLKELPSCPHCGAAFSRPIGSGETVQCENCGKAFSG